MLLSEVPDALAQGRLLAASITQRSHQIDACTASMRADLTLASERQSLGYSQGGDVVVVLVDQCCRALDDKLILQARRAVHAQCRGICGDAETGCACMHVCHTAGGC